MADCRRREARRQKILANSAKRLSKLEQLKKDDANRVTASKMHNEARVVRCGGLRKEKGNGTPSSGKKTAGSNKQKKVGVEFSLPYDQQWPPINSLHERMVLDEMHREFRARICEPRLTRKHLQLKRNHPAMKKVDHDEILRRIQKKIRSSHDVTRVYEKQCNVSEHLLIGINAVTRYLEKRGEIQLLVVCRSAQPSLMTQHLLVTCLLRNIPACAVNALSETVSPPLGLKSTLAVAFKPSKENPFANLIQFIRDKIPAPEENRWLSLWKREPKQQSGRKRKLNELLDLNLQLKTIQCKNKVKKTK